MSPCISKEELYKKLKIDEILDQYLLDIANLESSTSEMHNELIRLQELESKLPEFQEAYDNVVNLLQEEQDQKQALLEHLTQLETESKALADLNLAQQDELTALKQQVIDLEAKLSAHLGFEFNGAINHQTWLRKKERENAVKYQRDIADLKKQVELVLEQKEEKWFHKKNQTGV